MGDVNNKLERAITYLETNIGKYPTEAPFNPPEKYPEYSGDTFDEQNNVYSAIRDLLYSLGLDQENFGTKKWNPLGELIKPGDNVVIKPNFVSEPRIEKIVFEAVITHPSIIRPLIDYSLIALKGKGSLVVADAPQTDSNIEKIKSFTKIEDIVNYVNLNSDVKVDFIDLRYECTVCKEGVINQRELLDGDPKGYTIVDLGKLSQFSTAEQHMNKIYGADYDYDKLRKHHCQGKHEYYVSNTILDADVIINVPKLKTHKKAGITVCLKNLVGINGNKNYLPHHRFGSTKNGGDEYPGNSINDGIVSNVTQFFFKLISRYNLEGKSFVTLLGKFYNSLNKKNVIHVNSGNWHGNDTIWRTIVDLNNILLYANKEGTLQESEQRKYLAIVDGIIAGEGDGPMNPMVKNCGLLIGGFNPVSVDKLSAQLMGFDWKKIPQIYHSGKCLFPEKITVATKYEYVKNFHFSPPIGWKNHIELHENTGRSN